MLRSQSIPYGQSPNSSGATRLCHQAAMTDDRTGAIATTMKEYQNAGRIAARNDRPFGRYSIDIDPTDLHIVSYRPNRTDIIETFSSFGPSNRPRLGT